MTDQKHAASDGVVRENDQKIVEGMLAHTRPVSSGAKTPERGEIHSPGDGNHTPPGVFEKMDAVKERVGAVRELIAHWRIATPEDVLWFCTRIERVLTTIQDANVTYGIIGDDGSATPMMVERDAIVEALYGR